MNEASCILGRGDLHFVVNFQINKPLIEKKRRERINVALEELKRYVAEPILKEVCFGCREIIASNAFRNFRVLRNSKRLTFLTSQ